jgi:hypothetical protein
MPMNSFTMSISYLFSVVIERMSKVSRVMKSNMPWLASWFSSEK